MIGQVEIGFVNPGFLFGDIADIHHQPEQITPRVLPHRLAHMQPDGKIDHLDLIIAKPVDWQAAQQLEAASVFKLFGHVIQYRP